MAQRPDTELSTDLLARMEAQHAQVSALLDTVGALLPRFAQAADASLRDEPAAVLTAVSAPSTRTWRRRSARPAARRGST